MSFNEKVKRLDFGRKEWRIVSFVLTALFLGGAVYWIFYIPPVNLGRILVLFFFIFMSFFFLNLGIFKRLKIALWLASWVVLLFFLKYRGGGVTVALLISLLLWGIVKIAP